MNFEIHSIHGQTITSGTLKDGKGQLDVSSFAEGIYILTMSSNSGMLESKKFTVIN